MELNQNQLTSNKGKKLPLHKAKWTLSTFRAIPFNNVELEQCGLPVQPLAHAYPKHCTS